MPKSTAKSDPKSEPELECALCGTLAKAKTLVLSERSIAVKDGKSRMIAMTQGAERVCANMSACFKRVLAAKADTMVEGLKTMEQSRLRREAEGKKTATIPKTPKNKMHRTGGKP